jgi:hypothetical protein
MQSNENLTVVEPQRAVCGLPYQRRILVLATTSSGAANSQQTHHCAYLPTTIFAFKEHVRCVGHCLVRTSV